jgi:hypothetical protein
MHKKTSPDELNSVSVTTAARTLGVSRQSIYNWAASGRLHLHPMPGLSGPTGKAVQRVMRADLDRLKTEQAAAPEPNRPPYVLPWEHAHVGQPEWKQALEAAQDRLYRAIDQGQRIWQRGRAYHVAHIDQALAMDRAMRDADRDFLRVWDGHRETILRMLEKPTTTKRRRVKK